MKNKLFIFSIIFSLIISWLPVSTTQTNAATNYANLGIANDFNVFVFGNHTQKYSDSEGRVAVGNRAEYTNYDIGSALTLSDPVSDDLIVGESLYAVNGENKYGNTVIGTNGVIETYTMNNKYGQKEPVRKDVSAFFAQAEADLKNKSSIWSQLTPNATDEMQGTTLVLKGDNPELNVFSLKTEDFKNLGLFKLDVPDGAAVLINVFGTDLQLTNFALKKGEQDLPSSDGSRILWNFPNLINFDMKGFHMVGSVLAPYATLAPTGTGQINGTLIVKNFTNLVDAGIETHHFPFNVTLPMGDVVEKGTIEFTKVDKETGKGLEGAVFALYDNAECQGDAKYEATSNSNGLVRFEDLSYGTYYLKEIKAPEGYQIFDEIVSVEVNSSYKDLGKIEDAAIKGSIQFTKVDTDTENKLSGAVFGLYDNEKCEGEPKAKATSNKEGLVKFEGLAYGTYYVKELTAPEGYQLSEEIRAVTVDEELVTVDKFINERIKDLVGTIEFTKVDKETGKGLEGAVFGLYDNAECQGDAKYEATSNNNGLVRFEDLPYGTYYLKEIKAPEGYQIFDEILPVVVDSSYKNLGEIEDAVIKGSIQFTKVETDTENKLSGAVFGLYDNKECEGEPKAKATSDAEGLVKFEGLTYGTYYVKELTAPEGYQLSEEIRAITVDQELVTADKFINERIKELVGTIEFTKVDETDKELAGAVFGLYDNEKCEGEPKAKATSNKEGLVKFEGLTYGTYYVKELTAPEGYQLSEEIRAVKVDEELVTAKKFINERIKELVGTIEFTKVDKETGKGLEGAVFGLYDNAECQGDALFEAISKGDGLVKFENIPYGLYYLKETKAPEGYQAFNKILPVEVNDSYINLGKIEDEAIKDLIGSIELKKIDSKDKKVLEGAEFALYQDGKIVKTGKTDKNGLLTFENLSYGLYEIKETKAPKGYKLSDEVKKIEIKSNKKVEIEFENSLIDQPESSEDNDSTEQLVDSDSTSNSNTSEKVITEAGSKQQTSKGMFLNGLPQTGDALTRTLIVLGLIFVLAGVIFLTRRTKS